MVARYDEAGKFVGISAQTFNGESLRMRASEEHDSAKVFAWGSMGTMAPVNKPEDVE